MQTPAVHPTFIPKKVNTAARRKNKANPFLLASMLLFVVAVVIWGSLYLYYINILSQKNALVQELVKKAEEQNIVLKEDGTVSGYLQEVEKLDRKLKMIRSILASHQDASKLFDFLGEVTVSRGVRYNNISYNKDTALVTMRGIARDFAAIINQRNALRDSGKVFKVKIGSYSIDRESGNISFNLSFVAEQSLLAFDSSGNDADSKGKDDILKVTE